MYECVNRKSDEFREFGSKNHEKLSSGSKDIGFGSVQGQNRSFQEVVRNFWNFWSGWRVLVQNTGLLQNLEIFRRFLWKFGGFRLV
jgi:hypothetical protein